MIGTYGLRRTGLWSLRSPSTVGLGQDLRWNGIRKELPGELRP
jgi:hypothetical protein